MKLMKLMVVLICLISLISVGSAYRPPTTTVNISVESVFVGEIIPINFEYLVDGQNLEIEITPPQTNNDTITQQVTIKPPFNIIADNYPHTQIVTNVKTMAFHVYGLFWKWQQTIMSIHNYPLKAKNYTFTTGFSQLLRNGQYTLDVNGTRYNSNYPILSMVLIRGITSKSYFTTSTIPIRIYSNPGTSHIKVKVNNLILCEKDITIKL